MKALMLVMIVAALAACAGTALADGSVPYYLSPANVVGPLWTVDAAGGVTPGEAGSSLFGTLFGPAGAGLLASVALLVSKRSRSVLKERVVGGVRNLDGKEIVSGLLATVGLMDRKPAPEAYAALLAKGRKEGWIDEDGKVVTEEAS